MKAQKLNGQVKQCFDKMVRGEKVDGLEEVLGFEEVVQSDDEGFDIGFNFVDAFFKQDKVMADDFIETPIKQQPIKKEVTEKVVIAINKSQVKNWRALMKKEDKVEVPIKNEQGKRSRGRPKLPYYECNYCPKKFLDYKDKRYHVDTCQERFQKNEYELPKGLVCNEDSCKQWKFKTLKLMKEHFRINHPHLVTKYQGRKVTPLDPKNFKPKPRKHYWIGKAVSPEFTYV